MALQQSSPIQIPVAYEGRQQPRVPQYVTDLMCFPGPVGVQPIVVWNIPSYGKQAQGISGVNIYRSYDDPFGSYQRVNVLPVTTGVYNDNLVMRYVDEQPLSRAEVSFNGRPYLVLRASQRIFSNLMLSEDTSFMVPVAENRQFNASPRNFLNQVYGEVLYKGQRLFPSYIEGDLFYISLTPYLDDSQQLISPVVGNVADYRLHYFTCQASPDEMLMQPRVYYKVVPLNHKGEEITPLADAAFCEYNPTRDFAWVWQSALRRNFWLMWFGGEDVLVYLRKWMGPQCSCQSGKANTEFECPVCLGTGIVGGYTGPYEIKMIFETTQSSRAVNDFGTRIKSETRGIFLPLPYLRTGDVVIRRSGQKMALGNVENITNRGVILQQEFDMGDCNNSLKFALPDTRGVRQFFTLPDHPDQVNTQKGAQPSFAHLQLGPG